MQRFHIRIEDAAEELGTNLRCLQKWCRYHGIKRWPYRSLGALLKSITRITDQARLQPMERHGEVLQELLAARWAGAGLLVWLLMLA